MVHTLAFIAKGGRLALLVPEAILQADYADVVRSVLRERSDPVPGPLRLTTRSPSLLDPLHFNLRWSDSFARADHRLTTTLLIALFLAPVARATIGSRAATEQTSTPLVADAFRATGAIAVAGASHAAGTAWEVTGQDAGGSVVAVIAIAARAADGRAVDADGRLVRAAHGRKRQKQYSSQRKSEAEMASRWFGHCLQASFRHVRLVHLRERLFDGTDEPVVVVAGEGFGEPGTLAVHSLDTAAELEALLRGLEVARPHTTLANGRRSGQAWR